jgi:hypothetical protein
MTFTVFTAVLGDTDPLKRPTVVAKGIRYVCFADRPIVQPPYEIVRVSTPDGPRLTSRRLKILADHPALGSPEASLWHDAAFQLACDPRGLLSLLDGTDMLALRHPHRDQIEDEAAEIARFGYVDLGVLTRQVANYRGAGFVQTAITSTGLCLRRHTPAVAAFNRAWWAEVRKWHWRDQMSVDYARWITGVQVKYLSGHYRQNPYARWSCYQPKAVTA